MIVDEDVLALPETTPVGDVVAWTDMTTSLVARRVLRIRIQPQIQYGAAGADRSWKNRKSSVRRVGRNMIRPHSSTGGIRRHIHAGKRPELVGKVRLIVEAAAERQFCPPHVHACVQLLHRALEALDAEIGRASCRERV